MYIPVGFLVYFLGILLVNESIIRIRYSTVYKVSQSEVHISESANVKTIYQKGARIAECTKEKIVIFSREKKRKKV